MSKREKKWSSNGDCNTVSQRKDDLPNRDAFSSNGSPDVPPDAAKLSAAVEFAIGDAAKSLGDEPSGESRSDSGISEAAAGKVDLASQCRKRFRLC